MEQGKAITRYNCGGRKINMITKISIQNVKGYGIPGRDINLMLDPNKVNLCVAPNGFGKSSLAAAFESMNRNRLDVPEDKKHVDHKADPSSLTVTIDGQDYVADNNKNEIIQQVRPYVIHNRTQVDYIKKRFKSAFVVNAFMEITPIVVCPIPEIPKLDFYSITAIRKPFGSNKKVVSDVSPILSDNYFCLLLPSIFPILHKFEAKKRWAKAGLAMSRINALKGNEAQVIGSVTDEMFAELESDEDYQCYLNVYKHIFRTFSKFDKFNVFYQLQYLWVHHREALRKLSARAEYEYYKKKVDANLHLLDSTGRNIKTIEKDGSLIVIFPHADEISNGQRDVLTFATELMIFRASLRRENKYILIIDEVFDYLDDANTLAAQYHLSRIVGKYTGSVYVVLLTHLNPYSFRNYVFNKKIINEVYLEDVAPVSTEDMMKFISFREWLEPKRFPERQATYDNLSRDLFHYNPNASDRSAEIAGYHRAGVKSTWGNPTVFRGVLVGELNKYLSGQNNYDPYAVAMALRLRVEKVVYDKLQTQELKDEFVATYKTNEKLEFCERHNIVVPDTYFIVNSIHNEADHLKQNPLTGRFEEKAMVYKLQNGVVHHIVAQLFQYKGEALDASVVS